MSEGSSRRRVDEASPARDASGRPVRPRAAGDIVADKYVLERYLARGGMSEVWLATHLALRTPVAVKFVDERLAHDPVTGPYALERFRFEAQISARLAARTRHVVAVQDAGMHDDVPYLVMEYVTGRTLEAELEASGPLAPARFADVLDQMADALGAAHALGILHRDLKPSNLLLCETEGGGAPLVKLADFGVAKAVNTNLAVDRPRDTQRGEIVGSPAFMSPEQLRDGTGTDARSDVWSVGVVAYEALTGRSCFQGQTVMDTFAAIMIGRYAPASSIRPDLPRGIDAWLARALSLDPSARFASVHETAQAFRVLVTAPAGASRKPLMAAALVALLALGGILAVFEYDHRSSSAAPALGASANGAVAAASVRAPTSGPAPGSSAAAKSEPAPSSVKEADPPSAEPSATPAAHATGPVRESLPRATHPLPLPTAKPAKPSARIDPSEIQ